MQCNSALQILTSRIDQGIRSALSVWTIQNARNYLGQSRCLGGYRILLYVRLLQGLANEALGAHAFTQHYLSQCLPQVRERFLDSKDKADDYDRTARDNAHRAGEVRSQMAKNPAGWTHDKPDTRGDLEVGFETQEQAIARFNDSHEIQYIEDPERLDMEALHYRKWSDRYRKQMQFYEVLIQLAEKA